MNEQIALWGRLAGIDDVTDRSDLVGLFQNFLPTGAGIESIFNDHAFGEEILERVRECYQCTQSGYRKTDAYFIPRPEEACSESQATELLRQHFSKMRELANLKQDRELLEIVSNMSLMRVATQDELKKLPLDDDSPDAWIWELVTDFLCFLPRPDSRLILLEDAMYSIANNRFVSDYLLWPLYKEASTIDEPFLPAFQLWKQGVSCTFRNAESCKFVVYENVAPSK